MTTETTGMRAAKAALLAAFYGVGAFGLSEWLLVGFLPHWISYLAGAVGVGVGVYFAMN